MPANFLKAAVIIFAALAIGAVAVFNGGLLRPDASQIVTVNSSLPYYSLSPVSSDYPNIQQSYYPSPIIDPAYSPPVMPSISMPSPIIDPPYSPTVIPSPIASVSSSVPSPSIVIPSPVIPSSQPSPVVSCRPNTWFSFWRPPTNPCPTIAPSPAVSPTVSPCNKPSFFNWMFRRRNCPSPQPSPNQPSPQVSVSNGVTSPSPSPSSCQVSTITSYRPWWAFWLPKVTTKYGKCPSPSPSAQPSSQPSQKPSPKPSGKKSPSPSPKPVSDIIRLYVDLGLKSRHDDMEFKSKRATLYWYATSQGERKISFGADNRVKRDSNGRWYIDFTPSDLGQKEIPSGNYCVEIAYRFKNGSLTGNQYPAANYVTYSDREFSFGQAGVFPYDTTRYGLYETIGYEFKEPTSQQRVFCPTNTPTY